MDIFIINIKSAENVPYELLEQFKKKKITNKKTLIIHCLTYLMLDRILKEVYKIQNPEIIFNNKKPLLKSQQKFFSISHSEEYITIAFSDYNCGIDIEKIKQRNLEKIAKRMSFHSSNLKEFYLEWTKYEALYKLGNIAHSVSHFEFENYIITALSENPNEIFEIYFQN